VDRLGKNRKKIVSHGQRKVVSLPVFAQTTEETDTVPNDARQDAWSQGLRSGEEKRRTRHDKLTTTRSYLLEAD